MIVIPTRGKQAILSPLSSDDVYTMMMGMAIAAMRNKTRRHHKRGTNHLRFDPPLSLLLPDESSVVTLKLLTILFNL